MFFSNMRKSDNHFTFNPGPPLGLTVSVHLVLARNLGDALILPAFSPSSQSISPPKDLSSLFASPLLARVMVAAMRSTENSLHWSPPLPSVLPECPSAHVTLRCGNCQGLPAAAGMKVRPSSGPQAPTQAEPCQLLSLPLRAVLLPHWPSFCSSDGPSFLYLQHSSFPNGLPFHFIPQTSLQVDIISSGNPFLVSKAPSLHIPIKRCPSPSEHISAYNFIATPLIIYLTPISPTRP